MLNPDRVLSYTDDEILKYYAGSRWTPTDRKELNHIMREQLLQLREIRAFVSHLSKKGTIVDDGIGEALEKAIQPLQEQVRKANVFSSRE